MVDISGLSWSLVLAAAGIALIHTLLGPDHYLPFVMLSRARRWSTTRTLAITGVCGLGHVASSVLLGGIGLAFGMAVGRFDEIESGRGSLAAWALVALGIAYALWGVRHAMRSSRGLQPHRHHGPVPLHIHSHGDKPHQHPAEDSAENPTTFWALFTVFVLGPCEPLIPLFVLPASRGAWGLALMTAAVFGIVTIATMVTVTAAAAMGIRHLSLGPLERWSHTLAGAVITSSGLAVIFLGL